MSTPTFDPDDPRLTTYALGEADQTDRQAVEAYLAESAEGRAEVEQTREIARILAAEYVSERDHYLAIRPEGELASNIVAFRPGGRTRDWRSATVLTLKIAAVVALTASLVYLTLYRSRRPDILTAASAPPNGPTSAATPGIVTVDQFSKDSAVAVRVQAKADKKRADALENPRPEVAPMVPAPSAGSDAEMRLTMGQTDGSGKIAQTEADGRTPETVAGTVAAPPSFALDSVRSVPGAASTATATAPQPGKVQSADEQITRSLVRVRTATGVFFSGVIVSADGLILAAPTLPESSLQQPCTVLLSDHRELPTVGKPTKTDSGWYWFLIDAGALSAATLANTAPASDAPLTAASVDPETGVATITQVSTGDADSARRGTRLKLERPSQAIGDASFAFNAARELLVIDQSSQQPVTAIQPQTRARPERSRRIRVRPFTDAERATLQRATEQSKRR